MYVLFPPYFSNCSLNSLNCGDMSSCHTERTITHTPPNQDGRATPSPEHVSTADCFDDNHASVPEETHDGLALANSSGSPTATNNARNTKETEQTDENFNSFHYWRSPLPDISGELEMLTCQTSKEVTKKQEKKKAEEEEEPQELCSDTKSSHGKATSDQIQKVLDCLQPHIADPDVQGEYFSQDMYNKAFGTALICRFSFVCNVLPAQVQVLSAALKAAQLDSPTDNSPTEPQPEEVLPENNSDSPVEESKSVEDQPETEETCTEEEQIVEPPLDTETCPVQEQGDEETQTEPLEDQEESPPDSPVLVRVSSDHYSVLVQAVITMQQE